MLDERPNLTVMDRSIVHSLTIENSKCVGLHVGNGNRLKRSTKTEHIKVDGELILCGGAFETPKVLQMSGIGNKEVRVTFGNQKLYHFVCSISFEWHSDNRCRYQNSYSTSVFI